MPAVWPCNDVIEPSYFRGTISSNVFTAITTGTVNVHWLRFTHNEGATIAGTVNVANTAGNPIIADAGVIPGVGFRDHLYFENCVGLKAKVAGGVTLNYLIAYT